MVVGEVEDNVEQAHTQTGAVTRATRAGAVHCACVSHSSDCVRLCLLVSSVMSVFCARGRCAESPHTRGVSKRAFPKGETPATASTSHHYPFRCALRVRTPSHLLSSCSTTTKLRQTTGCVSPDRLASFVDCSLSLLHHSVVSSHGHTSDRSEYTQSPRHPRTLSRVCRKCSQPLVPSRSSSHLR